MLWCMVIICTAKSCRFVLLLLLLLIVAITATSNKRNSKTRKWICMYGHTQISKIIYIHYHSGFETLFSVKYVCGSRDWVLNLFSFLLLIVLSGLVHDIYIICFIVSCLLFLSLVLLSRHY